MNALVSSVRKMKEKKERLKKARQNLERIQAEIAPFLIQEYLAQLRLLTTARSA